MTKGQVFWVLMILWAISGIGWWRGWEHGMWGFGLLGFALFFLLGWHNFGFVIH